MKQLVYNQGVPLMQKHAFTLRQGDMPSPTGRDLLVNIKAISVNPVDAKIRARSSDTQAAPVVLGWDAAAVVTAVGVEVTGFKPGDEVFYAGDVTRPGCYASHQLVDERLVSHKPDNLAFHEAAALPLTSLTAWEALFHRMYIRPNAAQKKSILIIGAAGGVGSMAIQLARQKAGLTVIATASREETRQWCFELGADQVLNHHEDLVKAFTQAKLAPPDYILCLHDTDTYFATMAELIAPQGLICAVVDTRQKHDLSVLKAKSAGFVWEFMFTRSKYETDDMAKQGEILKEVAVLVEQGILKTTMKRELGHLSGENICQAHNLLESGTNIGKIVLHGFD